MMHLTGQSCHQLNLFIHTAFQTLPVLLVAFIYSTPCVHAHNQSTSFTSNSNGLLHVLTDPDPRTIQFGKAFKEFTDCILNNPTLMCRECKDFMNALQESYLALTKAVTDGLNVDPPVDQSVVNIAKDLYQSASEDLWIDLGNCDRCPFDGLVHFNRLIEIFKDCVNEYKNDSCSQCFKSYADLNNLYIELESSGNTCLDSNKEMSEAWEDWKKLKCHINASSDPMVIWLAGAIILVTLMLYIISLKSSSPSALTRGHTSGVSRVQEEQAEPTERTRLLDV